MGDARLVVPAEAAAPVRADHQLPVQDQPEEASDCFPDPVRGDAHDDQSWGAQHLHPLAGDVHRRLVKLNVRDHDASSIPVDPQRLFRQPAGGRRGGVEPPLAGPGAVKRPRAGRPGIIGGGRLLRGFGDAPYPLEFPFDEAPVLVPVVRLLGQHVADGDQHAPCYGDPAGTTGDTRTTWAAGVIANFMAITTQPSHITPQVLLRRSAIPQAHAA